MDGWSSGETSEWMDEQMDGDEQMSGRMNAIG